jgi:Protein of unknown function (DUF3147)
MLQFNPSTFRRTSPSEYLIRFFFGGLITVVAGVIAKKYGPAIGGLFLGFPAIFPAAATLIEKAERQKKRRHGLHGATRGRQAASLEAAGAVRGCVALLAFALVAWWLIPGHGAAVALGCSTVAWVAVVGIVWWTRHTCRGRKRRPLA